MSGLTKRKPTGCHVDQKGGGVEEAYQEYKLQTRGEYEDLMRELEFRCQRAAMMNYFEAASYEKKVFKMEVFSAAIGTLSLTSAGLCFLHSNEGFNWTSLSHAGPLGMAGVAAAFIVQLLSKGSSRILPSFSRRAQQHVEVGAAWQKLAQKTRSYRIQLDNPKFEVTNYAEWYLELITERESLCKMVIIPQSTYRLYNDPARVFRPLNRKRQMFLKFMNLEEKDSASDFEDDF